MKKTALTLMFIFALLFSGAELSNIAKAHFKWIFADVEDKS